MASSSLSSGITASPSLSLTLHQALSSSSSSSSSSLLPPHEDTHQNSLILILSIDPSTGLLEQSDRMLLPLAPLRVVLTHHVTPLLHPNTPCFVFMMRRENDVNSHLAHPPKTMLVSWIPESASVAEKLKYASAWIPLVRQFHVDLLLRANELADLADDDSLFPAFISSNVGGSVSTFPPRIMDDRVVHETTGQSTAPTGACFLSSFPISDQAKSAIASLGEYNDTSLPDNDHGATPNALLLKIENECIVMDSTLFSLPTLVNLHAKESHFPSCMTELTQSRYLLLWLPGTPPRIVLVYRHYGQTPPALRMQYASNVARLRGWLSTTFPGRDQTLFLQIEEWEEMFEEGGELRRLTAGHSLPKGGIPSTVPATVTGLKFAKPSRPGRR